MRFLICYFFGLVSTWWAHEDQTLFWILDIPTQRRWYHCPHDVFSQAIILSNTFGRLHPAAQSMLIFCINSLFLVKLRRFFCFCFLGNSSNFLSSKHFIKWLLIFSMSYWIGCSLMSSEIQNSVKFAIANTPQSTPFVCCWTSKMETSKVFSPFPYTYQVVIVLTVTHNLVAFSEIKSLSRVNVSGFVPSRVYNIWP